MIKDYIKKNSIKFPDKVFITIGQEKITYKQFDNYIYSIESFILSQEKLPKRVKIECSNKKRILASIIACNRTNTIPVVFPPDDKIIKFLNYDKIVKCNIEINDNSCIVQINKIDNRKSIFYKKNDVQCILFTSGTEMNPKAVELTYGNIYKSVCSWNEIAHFDSDDVYLNVLPLWHISGLSIFFRSIYLDFHSVILDYHRNKFFLNIKQLNINCISVVPKIISDMISGSNNKNIFKNFKIIIIGGDGINQEIFNYCKKNNINAYISYGMTETASGVCGYFSNDIDKYEHGFLGHPHKNTVIDIDNNYIKVTSKSVMKKYVNNKNCNGKFLTEDFGAIKNNKLFYYSRSSDSIVSGGENINLKIIRNVISAFDESIKVEVEGVSDDNWGEVPAVFIDKNKFNTNKIKQHCKNYLPKYMMPKYFIDFMDKKNFNKRNK